MISDQNCTTRGSITTLLHPFWNRLNTGLGQIKYFVDAVLSWFEIKFIHFLGGKKKEFWKQKLQNSPHDTRCLSFSCYLIGYLKKEQEMKRVTRREKRKACFIFSFTVLSAACILTSVFIIHLFKLAVSLLMVSGSFPSLV